MKRRKLSEQFHFCEVEGCSNQAVHKHHKFSDSKKNRELYGKLLDDDKNIMLLCNDCHLWKALRKYNERVFCGIMGIEPRSKSSQRVRRIE
jgi:hypothetical protein